MVATALRVCIGSVSGSPKLLIIPHRLSLLVIFRPYGLLPSVRFILKSGTKSSNISATFTASRYSPFTVISPAGRNLHISTLRTQYTVRGDIRANVDFRL